MDFKRILAYLGNFIFGGMPAVIELAMTEKDVKERTDQLYSEQTNLLSEPEENEEGSDD